MSNQNIPPKCTIKTSHPNVQSNCPIKMSHQNIPPKRQLKSLTISPAILSEADLPPVETENYDGLFSAITRKQHSSQRAPPPSITHSFC